MIEYDVENDFDARLVQRLNHIPELIRMAGVFIFSASTISLRTRAMPLWLVLFGHLVALVLLLDLGAHDWTSLVLPAWVFVISIWILTQRFGQPK